MSIPSYLCVIAVTGHDDAFRWFLGVLNGARYGAVQARVTQTAKPTSAVEWRELARDSERRIREVANRAACELIVGSRP